jgi:hypothetical protein
VYYFKLTLDGEPVWMPILANPVVLRFVIERGLAAFDFLRTVKSLICFSLNSDQLAFNVANSTGADHLQKPLSAKSSMLRRRSTFINYPARISIKMVIRQLTTNDRRSVSTQRALFPQPFPRPIKVSTA